MAYSKLHSQTRAPTLIKRDGKQVSIRIDSKLDIDQAIADGMRAAADATTRQDAARGVRGAMQKLRAGMQTAGRAMSNLAQSTRDAAAAADATAQAAKRMAMMGHPSSATKAADERLTVDDVLDAQAELEQRAGSFRGVDVYTSRPVSDGPGSGYAMVLGQRQAQALRDATMLQPGEVVLDPVGTAKLEQTFQQHLAEQLYGAAGQRIARTLFESVVDHREHLILEDRPSECTCGDDIDVVHVGGLYICDECDALLCTDGELLAGEFPF